METDINHQKKLNQTAGWGTDFKGFLFLIMLKKVSFLGRAFELGGMHTEG